ncbi:MAG: hypothetical protein AAFY43_07330 [Pseudomonadota bacterium]
MPKITTTEIRMFPIILHEEDETYGYFCPPFGGGGAASQQANSGYATVSVAEGFVLGAAG